MSCSHLEFCINKFYNIFLLHRAWHQPLAQQRCLVKEYNRNLEFQRVRRPVEPCHELYAHSRFGVPLVIELDQHGSKGGNCGRMPFCTP